MPGKIPIAITQTEPQRFHSRELTIFYRMLSGDKHKIFVTPTELQIRILQLLYSYMYIDTCTCIYVYIHAPLPKLETSLYFRFLSLDK